MRPDARLYALEAHQESARNLSKKGIVVHALDDEREPFPFAAQSMGVVIANQILEHTKELFWIFLQISRVLRDGGSLIIGVPNLAAFHNRLLLMFGRQPSPLKNASAQIRGFTKSDILRTFTTVFPDGYVLRNFGGSNFYPLPPVLARQLAAVLPGMAWGIFLRLEKQRSYNHEFLEFPRRAELETNFFVGEGLRFSGRF